MDTTWHFVNHIVPARHKFKEKINGSNATLLSCSIVLIVLVMYPLFQLIYGSFGRESLTLKYYIDIFAGYYLTILGNTLLVSAASTMLATAVGILLAWIINRTNTPFRGFFEYAVVIPYYLSALVIAATWIIIAGPVGLISAFMGYLFGPAGANVFVSGQTGPAIVDIYSLWGMIWVIGIYNAPLVFIFTSSGLKSMDPSLEEASVMSGAGILRTAFGITLPLIAPSIISSALLVFVSSTAMFSVPLILGRPTGIYLLSTAIYDLMNSYPPNRSAASAMSIFLSGITSIGVYLQGKFMGRREFVTVTGKGLRAKLIDIGRWRYAALAICMLHFTITIALPIFALTISSLMTYFRAKSLELTLENYYHIIFRYPLTGLSIKNSLFLGVLSATLCTFLALMISFVLVRTTVRGRSILDFISMIPVAIPHSAFAVALLWTWIFVPLPIYGTLWILLIAYVTLYSSYAVRASTSNLRQVDPQLEECARVCGASWWQTMRKITFPLIRPGLLAAWVILFINCIREINASILLYSYGNQVMSVTLYELWWEGSYSVAAAVAVIQIVLVFAVLAVARRTIRMDPARGLA